MTKIKQLPISQIRKMDLPKFTDDILGVTSKHNPGTFYISELNDTLYRLKPYLQSLSDVYWKHEGSDKQQALRIKRNGLLQSFWKCYKAEKQAKIVLAENYPHTASLELVAPLLDRYLGDVQKGNTKKRTGIILQLEKAIDENEPVRNAMQEIGLLEYKNQVRNVLNSADIIEKSKISYRASLPRKNTDAIRAKVKDAIKNLFSAIELESVKRVELDYNPLISELNEVITSYSSEIKTRNTIRKSAKLKVAETEPLK